MNPQRTIWKNSDAAGAEGFCALHRHSRCDGILKPSVSVAMKNLRENGYISMDPDGFIKLEQPGMEIAQRIYGRHRKLTAFCGAGR